MKSYKQTKVSKDNLIVTERQSISICGQINPLTPKISFVILLTVRHTVLVMLVWRI